MIKRNACPACGGDVIGRSDKTWCSQECRSALRDRRPYNVAYYHAHKDRLLAQNKAWRTANRDRVVLKRRQWVEKNIDAVRLYQREYQRGWYPRNRARQSEYQSRRRDLKAAGGRFALSPRDYARLTARHGGRCAYCPNIATEWDHVVPLSRGGRHSVGNLLPTCLRCNRSKGSKLLFEWRLLSLTDDGFDLGSLTTL